MINLKSLNSEQKEAVKHDTGPSIIVAGAGSGKTRALTYKVAYLLDSGVEPRTILALTFTNKAANEMKERIRDLAGAKADYLWMGTFHSICARILRVEAEEIGYSKNFSIYDTEDSASLVANVAEELNISLEETTPNRVRGKISYLKNQMIFPDDYRKTKRRQSYDARFQKIYDEYERRLKINDAMDFDDLLLKPLELFESRKILQKYKKRFDRILVDEFQDTNKAQYLLLKALTNKTSKITVVGDDSQSIYGWRGAELDNMLDFEKEFTRVKRFTLERNYRSTKTILAASDSVIKKNKKRIDKTLWTENDEGEPVGVIKCSDEKDEAYQIARLVKEEIQEKKRSYGDFAVFYRTNAQSRAVEDVFRMEKIPYVVVGGVEFYRRKEVKDILAYLRVIVNRRDEESLLRIMNFPQRGIGQTTVNRMIAFARKHEATLFETMTRVFEVIEIKERIQKNVKNFKLLLDKYIGLKDKLEVGELTRTLVDELGVIRMLKEERSLESLNRLDNVEELLKAIDDFSKERPKATLEEYLQTISLTTDLEQLEDERNVVSLLTAHSAKGLEFNVAFVAGLEEDVFPLSNRFEEEANLEEERRLFYVAMTRARERLYLTHARSRYRFGEVAYQERSRFIDEISPELTETVEQSSSRRANRKTKKEMYLEIFENIEYEDITKKDNAMKVGSRVMHERFGLGKVVQLVGAGDRQKATVVFEGNNIKQLMLKFAKLKVLN
ncbi:MAG: AAA family ATPase [Ignavibacteriales bacterium]|nr:AAA family ATPase [Ignavibacteriales bacterium]